MSRRLFNHLVAEISIATGIRVPRFALWMELHELGCNPEAMTVEQALEYLDGPLEPFLSRRGLRMSPQARRRMRRAIAHFSPNHPTRSEHLESYAGRS